MLFHRHGRSLILAYRIQSYVRFSTGSTSSLEAGAAWDLAVIGGGSGGLAAAKAAKAAGAEKVVCFDYVKPSTQGTRWGLGGTCVNVGCVPKKLMHYAGLLGACMHDAKAMGFAVDTHPTHDWGQLVQTVQNQVKQLNFGYRGGLRSAGVEYINALASFQDPHTLAYQVWGQEPTTLRARHIVIATGGRPIIPDDVPGAREYAITSDDIFSLRSKSNPGKTLCIGASYIALECAGFLTEIGCDVTVAVRSVLLRGFDRQCADKIGEMMRLMGTKFMMGVLPSRMEKNEDGRISVTFSDGLSDVYDTVLYAIGRSADTAGLNLEAAGIAAAKNGKFQLADDTFAEQPHIHAVGDVLQGRPELTPVAIKAGEILARRIFAGTTQTMRYDLVPTTVFTPCEYGTVGLTEEEAVALYGEDELEVYIKEWTTLEHGAVHRVKHANVDASEFDQELPPSNLMKLICIKAENERVVGFHFVGPNAGEVTQGFTLALKLGATKADFDDVLGIHPTDAEGFCDLSVTRRSGESWLAAGGCGGGRCG